MDDIVAILVVLRLDELATLITTIYLHCVLSHKSIEPSDPGPRSTGCCEGLRASILVRTGDFAELLPERPDG